MTGPSLPLRLDSMLQEEPFLRRFARGLLFDEHRVDDVVQETWIAALEARKTPSERRSARAWLSTVARRQAANDLRSGSRRRRREERAAEDEVLLPSADEVLEREEQRQIVVNALRALPQGYRDVLVLRYFEGLEPSQIARRREVPAATVRSQLRRGLSLMREELDRRHGDRQTWCLALVPVAVPRDGSTAGVATTLVTTSLLMKTLLSLAAVLVCGFLIWQLNEPDAPPPRVGAMTNVAEGRQDADEGDLGPTRSNGALAGEGAGPDDTREVARTADPGSLSGRLLDDLGNPMPNALIRALALDGPNLFNGGKGLKLQETRTDSEGRFELVDLPAYADCGLLADADGDLRQFLPIAAGLGAGVDADLGDLQLQSRGAVRGEVVDADGHPVEGARVIALDLPGLVLAAVPVHRFHPTSGTLLFAPRAKQEKIDEASARYGQMISLTADATAEATTPREPSRAETEKHRFESYALMLRDQLRRIGRYRFDEFDGEDFQPLVLTGDRVLPIWETLPIPRATTDSEGRFSLGGLTEAPHTVIVVAPGFQALPKSAVRVEPRATRDLGVLTLREGSILSGRVLDEEGAVVEAAEVRTAPVGLAGYRGVTPCFDAVLSGAEGRFEIDGLDRGRSLLLARRGPGHPWTVKGPVSNDDDIDIELPKLFPITVKTEGLPEGFDGTVEISVRPTPPLGELAGLETVDPMRPIEATPADGGLLCQGLSQGTWTIQIDTSDGHTTQTFVDLEGPQEIVVAFEKSRTLTARVLDAEGQPVVQAEIQAVFDGVLDRQRILPSDYGLPLWQSGLPRLVGTTDGQGLCKLPPLPLGTQLVVRDPVDGDAVAMIEDEEDDLIDLELGGAARIEGFVRTGPQASANNGSVRLVVSSTGDRDSQLPTIERSIPIGPDGSFASAGLPVGTYEATIEDGAQHPLSIRGLFERAENYSMAFFGSRPRRMREESFTLSAGETKHLEFSVLGADPERGSVRGVVLANGRAIVGAQILERDFREEDGTWWDWGYENSPRATTSNEGSFEISDLEAKTWWFGIVLPGESTACHLFRVDIEAGGRETQRIDLQIGRVDGVVLDQRGAPVPDFTVSLQLGEIDPKQNRPWPGLSTSTDAQGRFVFSRVPTGPAKLSGSSPTLRLESRKLEVLPGDSPTGLRLQGLDRFRVILEIPESPAVPLGQYFSVLAIKEDSTTGARSSSSLGTINRKVEFTFDQPGSFSFEIKTRDARYSCVPGRIDVTDPVTRATLTVGPAVGG